MPNPDVLMAILYGERDFSRSVEERATSGFVHQFNLKRPKRRFYPSAAGEISETCFSGIIQFGSRMLPAILMKRELDFPSFEALFTNLPDDKQTNISALIVFSSENLEFVEKVRDFLHPHSVVGEAGRFLGVPLIREP